MAKGKGLRSNFSSWMSSTFNGVMDSLASRMNTSLNAMYSTVADPTSGAYRTTKTSDYLNTLDIDPNVYYDILKQYPYFNALVNIYADAVYEIVNKDSLEIACPKDKKLEDKLNRAIKDYKLKDFILANLHDFVKRGSYVAFINDNKEITSLICPYDSKFIMRKGRFFSASIADTGSELPFYDLFTYWYKAEVYNMFTVAEMEKRKKDKTDEHYDNLVKEVDKDIDSHETKSRVAKDETEEIKKFKKTVEVDTALYKGQSLFEPYLPDLFRVFIREYVWDALSLSDYLKSNVVTATVGANKLDVRKVMEIVNRVESMLNNDNINIVMTYADPLQLLNQINDKLINRYRVLPQVSDYSQLEPFTLNEIKEQLEALKADIEASKTQLQNNLKIPEEIFTGNGNRWELSSKYEEYTNSLVHILDTISNSVARFCVSYLYRTTETYYDVSMFEHKFDVGKYLSPYMNKSNLAILNDRMTDISTLLGSVEQVTSIKSVNAKKFLEYLQKELKNADPGLDGLIDFKASDFEGEEDNSGNNEGGGENENNEGDDTGGDDAGGGDAGGGDDGFDLSDW